MCRGKMERIFSTGRMKAAFFIFFLAGLVFRAGCCPAADPEQAGGVGQIEVNIIHVDQYAVYAPNLIFYFDTKMDKKKIAAIARAADHLRNKKATITYSSNGGLSRDRHVLLLDVTPAGEKRVTEKAAPDTQSPAAEMQAKSTVTPPARPEVPPAPTPAPVEQQAPAPPSREKKVRETAEPTAPITRDEISAFVRNILALNGRKDLSAVMPFYADKVDYYDRGLVDRDYVKRDLVYYYRNWDKISTSLDGDVVMIVLDPEVRIAKFISSFSVLNARKAVSGKTENIWKIQRINGQLMLVDVKQKMIGREQPGQ